MLDQMFNFEKLKESSSLTVGLDMITNSLERKGIDRPLAQSITDEIINYNQFKSFQFKGSEIKPLMEGNQKLRAAFSQRVGTYVDNIEKDLYRLTDLSQEEVIRIKDIIHYSFLGFLDSPAFVEDVEKGFNSLVDTLRNMRED
jgi:hypothetical protein